MYFFKVKSYPFIKGQKTTGPKPNPGFPPPVFPPVFINTGCWRQPGSFIHLLCVTVTHNTVTLVCTVTSLLSSCVTDQMAHKT